MLFDKTNETVIATDYVLALRRNVDNNHAVCIQKHMSKSDITLATLIKANRLFTPMCKSANDKGALKCNDKLGKNYSDVPIVLSRLRTSSHTYV
jgi:hypothetical protein